VGTSSGDVEDKKIGFAFFLRWSYLYNCSTVPAVTRHDLFGYAGEPYTITFLEAFEVIL
jgi:hypothetical protein